MEEKKKILIVEDEESYREPLVYQLTREGYDVSAAATGEEGLELFTKGGIDLVLLDLMLPGLDGTAITAIGNQQIGALADDDPRHLLAIEHRHGAAEGMIAMARHKEVGLAADTIARMTRKALVLDHIRVDHARERHDGVKQTH